MFIATLYLERAAYWILRGIILLGDYGRLILKAYNLTMVLTRPKDLNILTLMGSHT